MKRTFHVSYLKNTFCALASCALCTDEHIIQYIYTSNAKISQIDDQPDQGQQSHDYFQAVIYGRTYEVRSTINTSDSVLEHSFSFSALFCALFSLGTRKRGFSVPLVYCNEYRLSGYFFNRAFSVTKLENNKNTRPLARAFINFLVFRRSDETLALVYEIFHHNRYIGILYFAANDCFMTKWLCEYSFVSLIADSSLAFLDIRISVLMVSTRLEFTTNLQTLIVACCIHLRIQHMSRVLLLFRSFPDFVVNVMTTLIFLTNVPVFNKRGYPVSVFQVCHHHVNSQHYKRNKRKIPIAFYYSLSHFSLTTARFNPSFLKFLIRSSLQSNDQPGNVKMYSCTMQNLSFQS